MEFRLVLSGGIVQKGYVGYLIFCLKIDLRNTNLLRKNPINNNDQQHKNLAHSEEKRKFKNRGKILGILGEKKTNLFKK